MLLYHKKVGLCLSALAVGALVGLLAACGGKGPASGTDGQGTAAATAGEDGAAAPTPPPVPAGAGRGGGHGGDGGGGGGERRAPRQTPLSDHDPGHLGLRIGRGDATLIPIAGEQIEGRLLLTQAGQRPRQQEMRQPPLPLPFRARQIRRYLVARLLIAFAGQMQTGQG